jgi:hypothetical protein
VTPIFIFPANTTTIVVTRAEMPVYVGVWSARVCRTHTAALGKATHLGKPSYNDEASPPPVLAHQCDACMQQESRLASFLWLAFIAERSMHRPSLWLLLGCISLEVRGSGRRNLSSPRGYLPDPIDIEEKTRQNESKHRIANVLLSCRILSYSPSRPDEVCTSARHNKIGFRAVQHTLQKRGQTKTMPQQPTAFCSRIFQHFLEVEAIHFVRLRKQGLLVSKSFPLRE